MNCSIKKESVSLLLSSHILFKAFSSSSRDSSSGKVALGSRDFQKYLRIPKDFHIIWAHAELHGFQDRGLALGKVWLAFSMLWNLRVSEWHS